MSLPITESFLYVLFNWLCTSRKFLFGIAHPWKFLTKITPIPFFNIRWPSISGFEQHLISHFSNFACSLYLVYAAYKILKYFFLPHVKLYSQYLRLAEYHYRKSQPCADRSPIDLILISFIHVPKFSRKFYCIFFHISYLLYQLGVSWKALQFFYWNTLLFNFYVIYVLIL